MILKKLFNSNTGYFINTHHYRYNCKNEVGYIVCQGYRMFGIFGFDRLEVFTDKKEAENYLKSLI